MTKATTKPSTSSPAVNGNGNGRDAELHANIKQLAELWLSIIARETPADTDDPDFNEAMRLEFEIAATPVYTLRGYHAKCAAIARAEWDADDLATICLLMGRDIQRLGVTEIPAFIRDGHGEVWPGSMAERVELFAEVYAEGAAT
jgi:hypothetical protein